MHESCQPGVMPARSHASQESCQPGVMPVRSYASYVQLSVSICVVVAVCAAVAVCVAVPLCLAVAARGAVVAPVCFAVAVHVAAAVCAAATVAVAVARSHASQESCQPCQPRIKADECTICKLVSTMGKAFTHLGVILIINCPRTWQLQGQHL